MGIIFKRFFVQVLLCFLGYATFAQLAYGEETVGESGAEYRLVPGDKLKINVLGQADLTLEAQVNDNGTIIYPLLGELNVAGLTRMETEALIYKELKGPYLVEPQVSVTIVSYRQIFIQGEVKNPGPYLYMPGLTLRRAILNAGGFTDLAATGKIYVINEFDVDEEPKKVDLGYQLVPGDIITVKASFF